MKPNKRHIPETKQCKRGGLGSRLHDGDALWGFILGSSWGDGTRVRRGANGSARGGGWGEGGELSREGTERKEEGGGVQCTVQYCPVIALVITPLFPFHSAPPPSPPSLPFMRGYVHV